MTPNKEKEIKEQEEKELQKDKKERLVFDITTIDPNEDKLNAIVAFAKDITADPEKITKEELVIVAETRNKLVKTRTNIERVLKVEREDAKNYQKDVIAYEKKLIGIIEPEEIRLKEIEADTKAFNIRRVRMEKLPEMRARLATIGDEQGDVDDDFLLDLDPNDFEAYYNTRVSDKNEADRIALEEQKAKEVEAQEAKNIIIKTEQETTARKLQEAQDELDKEKRDLEHQKELEIAKKEAQKQAQEDAKAEAIEKARLEKETAEKLEMEQIEAKKKQEADEKYQAWLKSIGYTKENKDSFIFREKDTNIGEIIQVAYKEIGSYKK